MAFGVVGNRVQDFESGREWKCSDHQSACAKAATLSKASASHGIRATVFSIASRDFDDAAEYEWDGKTVRAKRPGHRVSGLPAGGWVVKAKQGKAYGVSAEDFESAVPIKSAGDEQTITDTAAEPAEDKE